MYDDNQEDGFTVLGINATQQDNQEAALVFARDMGLTFPILLDSEGKISGLYETLAFPTSFFIDREGIVRDVVVGGPMSEALLRIRVEQLIERSGFDLPPGD